MPTAERSSCTRSRVAHQRDSRRIPAHNQRVEKQRLDKPARVEPSDAEWRARLTPEQYRVLRRSGTEPPFTGQYVHVKDGGVYRCAGCGAELFDADAKYDSGTGWPRFFAPASETAVERPRDWR